MIWLDFIDFYLILKSTARRSKILENDSECVSGEDWRDSKQLSVVHYLFTQIIHATIFLYL